MINQIDVYWAHFFAFSVIHCATPTAIIYVIILALVRAPFHDALLFLYPRFDEWI